jgi:putative oxidoreductase
MDKINKMFAVWEPAVLSIFRIITGLLLFQFGVAKLFKFPPVPMFEKVEVMSLFGAAAIFEFIFGGLLILGLYSRLAAFILCGEMAFAYFIGHFAPAPGLGASTRCARGAEAFVLETFPGSPPGF